MAAEHPNPLVRAGHFCPTCYAEPHSVCAVTQSVEVGSLGAIQTSKVILNVVGDGTSFAIRGKQRMYRFPDSVFDIPELGEIEATCRREIEGESPTYTQRAVMAQKVRFLARERILKPLLTGFDVILSKGVDMASGLDGGAVAPYGTLEAMERFARESPPPPIRFGDQELSEYLVVTAPLTQGKILDALERRLGYRPVYRSKWYRYGPKRDKEDGPSYELNVHLRYLVQHGNRIDTGAFLLVLCGNRTHCSVEIPGGSRNLGETPFQAATRHTLLETRLDPENWTIRHSLTTGIQIFVAEPYTPV